MKHNMIDRERFEHDLPSIICSNASAKLKIEMIMRMVDKYTEVVANGANKNNNECTLPVVIKS